MKDFLVQFSAIVSAAGVTGILAILFNFNQRLTKIEVLVHEFFHPHKSPDEDEN